MIEVISVRFRDKGKVYYFDPKGVVAQTGDHIIVETAKGLEYGLCAEGNHGVPDDRVIPPLRPVIRVATEADRKTVENNKEKERRAFQICQKKIAEHGLDMKLVDVEYNFEGNKVLFFFTSEGRVDFRDLVKDLASVLRARIELRQIGVRDEAKMLGGLGICGKPFCCSTFLDDFQPVSIKMAKTQALSLNPVKISGTCGRLMCCLKYEQEAYEQLVKGVPKLDAYVDTPEGKGTVVEANILRQTVRVRMEDTRETTVRVFPASEVTMLQTGKSHRAELRALAEAEAKRRAEAGEEPQEASPASRRRSRPKPAAKPAAPAQTGTGESQPAPKSARPAHSRPPKQQQQQAKPAPDASEAKGEEEKSAKPRRRSRRRRSHRPKGEGGASAEQAKTQSATAE